MRVLALMKYGQEAASTRQRLLQYRPALAAKGIDVTVVPLLDDRHVRRLATGQRALPLRTAWAYARRMASLVRRVDADVIWVHCEAFPYLPAGFERLVLRSGIPVVFDYDDAIFHMYDAHRSGLVRRVLGGKLEPLIRGAALVLAGNAYLADYARRFSQHVEPMPTVVDTDAYVPAPSAEADAPVIVGWMGSPSTWRYVEQRLDAILPPTRRGGAVFRAFGAGPAGTRSGVESVRWTQASEVADIQAMDIGVMPLPDEQWARGKCGYKLIQYMGCGLPVVASPVGVNREIVRHGVNGFLAETDREWHDALERLLAAPDLRARMGAAGRESVVKHYSLQTHAPRLAGLLSDLGAA